jgi:hypothetical protein
MFVTFVKKLKEMRKTILFFVLLLCMFGVSSAVKSQVRILDEETKKPVPFATVTEKAQLVCYSDTAGCIKLPTDGNAEITIQDVAYQTYEGKVKDVPKEVILKPLNYNLNDIEVKASHPDYIQLKGYFRNYEVNSEKNDSTLKCYADGIVEYFIPINGGGVKHRLIEYRSFRKKSSQDKDSTSMMNSLDLFGTKVPKMSSDEPFPKETKFSKYQITNDGRLMVKDVLAGTVRTDSLHRKLMSINMLAPRDKYSLSIFGLVSVAWYKDIRTVYAKMKNNSFSWSGFISQSEYQKWEAKVRKKHDIIVDEYSEFYVQEHDYVSKDDVKKVKMTSSDKVPDGQNYTSPYWNDTYIPRNSYYVENMLGKMMKTISK